MFNVLRTTTLTEFESQLTACVEYIGLECGLNFRGQYTGDIHETMENRYVVNDEKGSIYIELNKGFHPFPHKMAALKRMAELFRDNGALAKKDGLVIRRDNGEVLSNTAYYGDDKNVKATIQLSKTGTSMLAALQETAHNIHKKAAIDMGIAPKERVEDPRKTYIKHFPHDC